MSVSPTVTQLYGISLPTKRRAATISQGQVATVQLQFLDNTGNPITLDDDDVVIAKVREVVSTKPGAIYTVSCNIDTAATGLVSFDVPAAVYNNPGVYNIEIADTGPDGDTLLFTNKFYLWVDRGLFGDPSYPNAGPPSIDEIRIYIRDNAPEENRLLDDFEFDLAEICQAAELGVRYWNEAQPPLNLVFNTLNYTVRDKWLQFIAGKMFQMAAHRFRRNHLPYQAGGLSVDDQNKFQQYDQIGMMLVQDYKEWVKMKKVSINCNAAITSSGSDYGRNAYVALNTGI